MFDSDEIVKEIQKVAVKKDPEKMAHYLYFIIKNYPDNDFIKHYSKNIRDTKSFLKEVFEWEVLEITQFITKLNSLTKYIIK